MRSSPDNRVSTARGGGRAFINRTRRIITTRPLPRAVLTCLLLTAAACGTRVSDETAGVVIVNAPAAGEVRRVLVSEGVRLKQGDAVVEIVVRAEPAAAATPRGE